MSPLRALLLIAAGALVALSALHLVSTYVTAFGQVVPYFQI